MAKITYAPGLSGAGTRPRALAWVGDKFKAGWCLYWCLVYVFKVPGLGDYDHDGDADAEDYWKAAVARGKVVHAKDIDKLDDIPAGVLLMWTGGSHDNGHAAYCLGKGRMVSTDLPTSGQIGECDIELAHNRWRHTFVGYVLVDANGFTLTRETPPKPVPVKKLKYKVSSTAGVQVRDAPSTKGKVLQTYKKGTNVAPDKVVVAEGRHWLARQQSNKRWVYMAREHFQKLS